jgi:hypothetical protein
MVASYVELGYGKTKFSEYCLNNNLKVTVVYKRYVSMMISLVMEALRAIEKFIEINCGIVVELLTNAQRSVLSSVLMNLRNYAGESTNDVFGLFLKSLYNLAQPFTDISSYEVYRTYQDILRLTNLREKEVAEEKKNKA